MPDKHSRTRITSSGQVSESPSSGFPASRHSARFSGQAKKPTVAVVGAGAFGGWTALHLLRQGARVTLLDGWGPANPRASSGDETRVMRSIYGPDRVYVEMAQRSLELWRELERRCQLELYHRTGVLWLATRNDAYEKASLLVLKQARIAVQTLSVAEARKRYPQINFAGVSWALYEKEAGYLLARRCCEAVLEAFLQHGGKYRQLSASPGAIRNKTMQALKLSDGSRLVADHYVFACGPWLGSLFPEIVGNRVRSTRQEVFFFGTPAGNSAFFEDRLPIWADRGPGSFYGIPGSSRRAFKLASDERGQPFDPTHDDRLPTPAGVKAARRFLEFRFPALKGAPLLEARVCQYENSPDQHFIVDRHPEAQNSWIVGGGSGHGFKHGPAVGERTAALVLGKAAVDPFFALSRLSK
ncbi:MAG: FAD-dependent oxidoreductase [Acidimicrobiia bacterium]|nr:FAD-dependent oxidoreductase [Acidimicrobiia bacterium]